MKSTKKALLAVLGMALIGVFITISRSPFVENSSTGMREVYYTVKINRSCKDVFDYLGNSSNAASWSSFVDHISTVNGDAVPDGQVGSVRRCFKRPDEKGLRWDEKTVKVEENTLRQLTIINMKGFDMKGEDLRTEQRYTPLSESQCELTFSLFFENDSPSISDWIKMQYASYSILFIFQKNLENVKAILEEKEALALVN